MFTTYLYGFFVKLGQHMGHASYGIALFIVIQMLGLAVLFSCVLEYLTCRGLHRKWRVAGTVFVALFPLFPLYAICMVKDVLYSSCFSWLVITLWELVRTSGDALKQYRWSLSLLFSSVFLMLTRNNGVYLQEHES